MIGSAGDVHLGVNIQLGENVRYGILVSLNDFRTQSPLHECHMSLYIT